MITKTKLSITSNRLRYNKNFLKFSYNTRIYFDLYKRISRHAKQALIEHESKIKKLLRIKKEKFKNLHTFNNHTRLCQYSQI